ncbi:Ig-like domain-containing protein [candidate division KSB1 bacterium]|nr:Ig-like domain-containing protein [candidate division KSB1 bacterium]
MLRVKSSFWLAVLLLAFMGVFFGCEDKYTVMVEKENGTIVGTVKPADSNARVDAVQETAVGSDVIDSEGRYRIDDLPPGVYILEVSAEGYGTTQRYDVIVYDGSTTAVSEIELSPFPDQIWSVSPSDGQRDVRPNTSICFSFREDMDQGSVEDAFDINPSIEVIFDWNGFRSVCIYSASYSFYPNTEYTVTLGMGAHTLDGDSLSFDYSFSFTTAPIRVNTRPEDGSSYVSTHCYHIIMYFNTQMKPSSLEEAFGINPENPGNLTFSSYHRTATMYFEPWERYLFSNTLYTITIDTSAEDVNGFHLEETFSFSFTTEPLRVEYYWPANGATGVSINYSPYVVFNTLMDQQSVEDAFSISPGVDGNFEWTNYVRFSFDPVDNLVRNTLYEIEIDTTCRAQGGDRLSATFSFSFTTEP